MTSNTFKFLGLPQELQDMVYEEYMLDAGITYVLSGQQGNVVAQNDGKARQMIRHRDPPLRSLCKEVRVAYDQQAVKLCHQNIRQFNLELVGPHAMMIHDLPYLGERLPLSSLEDIAITINFDSLESRRDRVGQLEAATTLAVKMPNLRSLVADFKIAGARNRFHEYIVQKFSHTVQAYTRIWNFIERNRVGRRCAGPPYATNFHSLQICIVKIEGVTRLQMHKHMGKAGEELWTSGEIPGLSSGVDVDS